MSKPPSNPNWGKPGPYWKPACPTSFEEIVGTLGLSPSEYASSRELWAWVDKHRDSKYVPPELLQAWGFCEER